MDTIKIHFRDTTKVKHVGGSVDLKGVDGYITEFYTSTLLVLIPELGEIPYLINDSVIDTVDILN